MYIFLNSNIKWFYYYVFKVNSVQTLLKPSKSSLAQELVGETSSLTLHMNFFTYECGFFFYQA